MLFQVNFSRIFLITGIFLFFFCTVLILDASGFDVVIDRVLFSPANEDVFFSRGALNGWEIKGYSLTEWAGGHFNTKVILGGESKLVGQVGVVLGPEHPDNLGSFIFSGAVPWSFGGSNNDFSKSIGPHLHLTARGFFSENMGVLSRCEIVIHAGSKIPRIKGWLKEDKIKLKDKDQDCENVDDKSLELHIGTNSSLMLGVNYVVVPRYLRVGYFFQILSSSFGIGYWSVAKKLFFNTAIRDLQRLWNFGRALVGIGKSEGFRVADTLPQENEYGYKKANLCSHGFMAEMCVYEELLILGIRVRKIFVSGTSDLEKFDFYKQRLVTAFVRVSQLAKRLGKNFPDFSCSYTFRPDFKVWNEKQNFLSFDLSFKF